MTICTTHLCRMKNRFIYKGTIILDLLIVLSNNNLLWNEGWIGFFSIKQVSIQIFVDVQDLGKTVIEFVLEKFISIYNI
jgi:hypothetical protein